MAKRKRSAPSNNRLPAARKRPSLFTVRGGRLVSSSDNTTLDYDAFNPPSPPSSQSLPLPSSGSTKSHTSGPIDFDTGQRSAFPIPVSAPTSNLDGPPLNVMDYLSRVNKEASARPCIVHISRPQLQQQNQQLQQPQLQILHNVVQFGGRTLRSYSDDLPLPIPTSRPPEVLVIDIPASSSVTIPTTRSESLIIDLTWHNSFLDTFRKARSTLAKTNTNANMNIALPDRYTDPNALPQSFSKWRQFFLDPENPPIVSLVTSFPHALLLKLLTYCQKWVSGNMSPLLGRWIYALLVTLPDTLTGDEIAVLRDLAKKCIAVRNSNRAAQPLLPQSTVFCLDMTVSIVAGFYAQKDLISNL